MTYLVTRTLARRSAAPVARPAYSTAGSTRPARPQVPVNIAEHEDAYELSLAAPGLKKEYFHLSVHEDVLTVRLELPADAEEATYTHREFRLSNFERRFHLPEQVDVAHIHATYQAGILTLRLPKRAEAHLTRSIAVQ